ncbi:hypothetical protein BKA69DRAFT_1082017 [Paraphysoderma sedebokerense]|nr:hypothetical protein BKA69DRAFT_1082017 [Paraphysoderma sedebokerense]
MASKKTKPQKISLQSFLAEPSAGSWADDEDIPALPSGHSGPTDRYAPPPPRGGYGDRDRAGRDDRRGGFGGRNRSRDSSRGGRGDRDGGFERPRGPSRPLPTEPPYTAFVGNLSYDITEADLEDFFGGNSVKNVRILTDRETNKPKGFGYVEFDTLESLMAAMDLSGGECGGRSLRIDPSATHPNNHPFTAKDRPADRTASSSWRRDAPLPSRGEDSRRDGGRGYGDRREGQRGFSDRREGSRGFGDRREGGRGGFGERREGGRGGFDRDSQRSGPRDFDRFGDMRREAGEPAGAPPMERKKLQLAPRSKPVESESTESGSAGSSAKKSNPFGNAKPVDTTKVLAKIEEKLSQKEQPKAEESEGAEASAV